MCIRDSLYGGHFDADAKKKEIETLESSTQAVDFWSDRARANDVLKKITNLKKMVGSLEKIRNLATNDLEILSSGDVDQELLELVASDITSLQQSLDEESLLLLLDGPYDSKNCILDIHSGAGGTEAVSYTHLDVYKRQVLQLLISFKVKKNNLFSMLFSIQVH